MKTIMIRTKLAEMLAAKGVTLYRLAKDTGIAYTTLHKLGSGETKGIKFTVLDGICTRLGCQPGDLIVHELDKPTKKGAGK